MSVRRWSRFGLKRFQTESVSHTAAERFEQVLMMESRRLGKVGCVAVITARLNGAMVEMMIRMHRMGPNLRLYLITFVPDDLAVLPLTGRLEHAGIEVATVTPEISAQ